MLGLEVAAQQPQVLLQATRLLAELQEAQLRRARSAPARGRRRRTMPRVARPPRARVFASPRRSGIDRRPPCWRRPVREGVPRCSRPATCGRTPSCGGRRPTPSKRRRGCSSCV
ncbi:MAG TPA: hypothetical protein EYM78_13405 [Gemmatimonadetes bacterium]|nr:hypothetical protein [Gemmatimonadota bacterium]HIN51677.1 hypothetical protein [Gemmatimonadota bacterium]